MSRVRASVVCYHCGHVSGHVVADRPEGLQFGTYVARDGGEEHPIRGLKVRCARCHGPVYFDEVEAVREREPIVIRWAGRGRPPAQPRPEIGVVVRDKAPIDSSSRRRRFGGPAFESVAVAVDRQPA